jgi:hypothetical protein
MDQVPPVIWGGLATAVAVVGAVKGVPPLPTMAWGYIILGCLILTLILWYCESFPNSIKKASHCLGKAISGLLMWPLKKMHIA